MKLKHVVAGAAVISLPLWAFALTRGQEANWTWVMATGDQVCSSDDEDPMSWCQYVDWGGHAMGSEHDRTANLFADFDLDGDADWIMVDLTANGDPYSQPETYDLTLRLVSGNGTGTWDVGQAEVVYTAECREGLERLVEGPGSEYWLFDPNTIYLRFPGDMNGDEDRGDGPVCHVQDVNGDTYPDLILEGLTYTITEGDDDGTGGTIQLIDRYNAMYTFLNTGGTGFRCAGDVDGDGQTRVGDLVGLLEDWGCDDSAQ
jgi:hypothetical protein